MSEQLHDFPFRSIPRAVARRRKNVSDDERTSAMTTRQLPPLPPSDASLGQRPSGQYLESVMKHTNHIFVEESQKKISSFEQRRHSTFQAPLPQLMSTVDFKYELIHTISDNGPKSITPLYARVRNMSSKSEFIAKLQQRKRADNLESLDFGKERNFLASISKRQTRDSRLSRLRDVGFDDDFRYLIVEDTGRDLKTLLQMHERFDAATTFLITYHSFQAIKELHKFDHLHLDLRPTSFSIQTPFHLKITDFYRVTPMKPKPQVASTFRPDRFSPRTFHTKHAAINEMDDFEAWLYVMMFVTCTAQLPWKSEKNEMLASKEALFKDTLAYHWHGSADCLMLVPYLMAINEESVSKFCENVDKLFATNAMSFDELETAQWENVMDDVTKPGSVTKGKPSCEETASLTPKKHDKLKREKRVKESSKRLSPVTTARKKGSAT